jgi:tetratricopeptide (TPR) repeat protein
MSSFHQVFSPGVLDLFEKPPVFCCSTKRLITRLIAVLLTVSTVFAASMRTAGVAAQPTPVQGDLVAFTRPPPQRSATDRDKHEVQATALLLRSALAQEENNTTLAFQSLRSSWSLNPANPSLAIRLAYEALETENAALAQSILGETARHCPKDSSLRVHQAVIGLRYESNPKLALGYAETAYRLAPANPRVINVLAETLSALGNLDRIEQLITACAALNVSNTEFWISTSETFAKSLFAEGELPHPQTLNRFNALLRKSISAGLSDPSHTEKNADICVLSSQLPEAIRLYRHCLAMPDNRSTPRRAQTHHKLARTLLSLDQAEDALLSSNQAVALDSSNPAHFELRAEIHAERKHFHLALNDLSRGADLDPESLELQLRTATLELKLHEFGSAAKRCRRLVEMFPSAPTPKVLRAIAVASMGKHEEAVAELNSVETLLTENEQAAIGPEILFPLGVAAEKAGLHEKAESLLFKCVQSESEFSSDAANHLAFMWLESGVNLEPAGQLITQAVRDRPENPYYRDTLGWWLFKKGQPKPALEELLRSVQKMPDPDRADVHLHIADVFINLSDPAQAVVHLKAAAEIRPDTPGLIEKMELLRIANPNLR